MGPSVRWRRGGQQLAGDLELLRFEVADINVVIRKACADSLHYGDDVVTRAGLDPGVGILPLSCFAVTAQWPAERLAAGTNYRRCRTFRATALLDAGYLLLPTAVFQDGQPDPRNDVHFDLVVLAAAGLPPPGMLGSKAERAAARGELLPEFERVLELLGPIVDLDV